MYPEDLAERNWNESNLGLPVDDERINDLSIRYVGKDAVIVERKSGEVHWSELPKPVNTWPPREFGDNNKSDPEQTQSRTGRRSKIKVSKLNQGDSMKKQDNRTALQHGEALLLPVNSMPTGKTEKVTSKIVAHSETGHHHVIESKTEFETIGSIDKKDLYLRLFEPAKLVHKKQTDKHKTLTVPVGDWKILHKSEYDPWAKVIRDVKD